MSEAIQDVSTPLLDGVLATLGRHHPEADASVVRRAHDLLRAERARLEEAGAVDDPRATEHAIDTAAVLADLRLDPSAVAAALVARVAVEAELEPARVREALGDEVAGLLDGVARLATVRWDRLEQEAAETLRKMFLAMAQDVRVVLVVLAMRVQRMRSLRDGRWDAEERRRYARETLDVFAPLANRLGIWQLKAELENGALRELEPERYAEIEALLAEGGDAREALVEEVVTVLREKLAEEGIAATVKGRAKHIYSIWEKMRRKDLEFDQLYDLRAVRVITERLQDCYAVLGLVHSTWVPVPSEFDDYIAKPKPNGYQSLHTAVIGPRGRPVEVQIRTREMHEYCEFGVAAHWAYKEGAGGRGVGRDRFTLLRQLMDWEREVTDPHDFVESLKTDIFEDQVYVFTPNGDVIDLPVGSTPLDFAYRVHTMVGHRCRGARVNDQIVPLDHRLSTGDRVEILTHKEPQPSRDWMNPSLGFLKTASARGKVRGWYRKRGRDEAVQHGREAVDRELSRLELSQVTVEDVAARFDYPKVEDLYAAVGYGDRSPHSVSSAALALERELAPPVEETIPEEPPEPARRGPLKGLRIGVDEVVGRRARCCNPVPGDDVVGFVTRGRGVAIHRRGCPRIEATTEPERLVEIEWGADGDQRHAVDVEIRASDRSGLMGDLSRLVTTLGVNIRSARAEGKPGGAAWLRMSLECRGADQVAQVLGRLDRHPDVLEVRRVGGAGRAGRRTS